ncbi:HAD family phosphatase [Flavobacteriaceae bacterium TP-CH-4]|uniref:HAD family phosphatase n=1 Tax=Pelagihabitans pacificus TaxID=2696054 RepID=A0A967E4J0_9FLAO|nr:HAD family phosphatase [Pelagihabitans pacificus]NHF58442.1 HAD family phosphatase [Pelagihabitans pacificus]
MIKAVIFDLDGTLVQTEVLKATSYAKAIHFLTNKTVAEEAVMDVFGKYVGLSRREVVVGLYEEFRGQLQAGLDNGDSEYLQDRLIKKRLSIYHEILDDVELLSSHFCPYNLGLLFKMHAEDFRVVLATMSHRREVNRIVELMGIRDALDFILTRDDVREGKPNPEIYLKAKDELGIDANECLVIEDSVNGIRAGLSAKMHVLAVTNNVTRSSVHSSGLLNGKHIVDELEELIDTVEDLIENQKKQ